MTVNQKIRNRRGQHFLADRQGTEKESLTDIPDFRIAVSERIDEAGVSKINLVNFLYSWRKYNKLRK